MDRYRLLTPSEEQWEESRELRLRALCDAPEAFSEALEVALERAESDWRARLRGYDRSGNFRVVAVAEDGRWVGEMAVYLSEGPRANLYNVWVTPEHRGLEGPARALLTACLTWAVREGVPNLHLLVRRTNRRAIAFYRRNGFVDTGGGDSDELELVRPLAVPGRPYLRAHTSALARDGSPLRQLTADDLPALGRVTALALAGTPDGAGRSAGTWAEELRRDLDPEHDPVRGAWLAIDDVEGRVAAFVATRMWWGTPFVTFLMTRPDQQRRGHGTRLLSAVAARVREEGHDELSLIVTRANHAFEFYRGLGFEEHPRP